MSHAPGLQRNQSLLRAVDLLRALGERPEGTTVSELARAAGLAIPTARRLVATLADAGLAEQLPTDGRWVLGRELVASLQFYQGQPDSLPLGEIILSGGTSRIPGLAAELARLTRVRVRLADPLGRVDVNDGVGDRDDLASLAIAIGLGVED